jgi:hypothetical protein
MRGENVRIYEYEVHYERFIRNRQRQDWMDYEAALQEAMAGTERGNHP